MLFRKCCIFVLTIVVGQAFAADMTWSGDVFLPGVSADGGYGNVKKYNLIGGGPDDSAMCSAAAAASVLTWWRNYYGGENLTKEQIYTMYDRICGYTGWKTTYAADAWNRYCQDVYGITCSHNANYVNTRLYDNAALNSIPLPGDCDYKVSSLCTTMKLEDVLRIGIENGYGMALRISRDLGGAGHTVSLWGAHWDNLGGDPYITQLIYADSDSYGGLVWGQIEARHVDGSAASGMGAYTEYYMKDSAGQQWRISAVDYLFHAWDAPRTPEPSTALLLVVVGLGVVSRRRRR